MSVGAINFVQPPLSLELREPTEAGSRKDWLQTTLDQYRQSGTSSTLPPTNGLDTAGLDTAGLDTATLRPCSAPSSFIKQLNDTFDTVALRDDVKLLDRAKAHVESCVTRMRDNPELGPKSPAAEQVGPTQASFDYVIAEAKKKGPNGESSLYEALTEAAFGRLKKSPNYEKLIREVQEHHGISGGVPLLDRAGAEAWIKRQFDYDAVDATFKAGEKYLGSPQWPYDGAWAAFSNKGNARVLGDKTDVRATGSFSVEFIEKDNTLLYRVENLSTGEKFAPRPYDPRGTIIEVEGLRAEMAGTPKNGDAFSFDRPAEYRFAIPDSQRGKDEMYSDKQNHKLVVFDRLFQGSIGRPGLSPSDIVLAFRHGMTPSLGTGFGTLD